MRARSRQAWLAASAAIALLVLMVRASRSFGATWDEPFHQHYGELIWSYLHGEIPRSIFDTASGLQFLYGGFFELTAVTTQHVFKTVDAYVLRHMVNAVFGWLGIVYAGRLAARAGGARAGWLAAALLALAPRYIGEAMNNPKDLPFAALSMVALYYTLTIEWTPPHLSWRHAAKLGAAIALALNVRPLGIVLLLYAIGFVMLTALVAAWRSSAAWSWRALATPALRLIVMSVVAVPAGAIFWPWAHASPFLRPIEAFRIASRLDWAGGFSVLYGGEMLDSSALPWQYVPWWLVMTLPPVLLLGIVLASLVRRLSIRAAVVSVALAAFAITPVAGAIVRHATIYDGIRHLLFIVPPLAVIAGLGWSAALTLSRPMRYTVLALLAVGVAEPLLFQLRNHPNQIVYFSPLTGGPRAAFARYDMDYWGNSMLQAMEWANAFALKTRTPLSVEGRPDEIIKADIGRFHALTFRSFTKNDAQLEIRLLRGPAQPLLDYDARPDVLFRVTTSDGAPIALVLPGPTYHTVPVVR